jgi:hypothetical protein
MSVTYSTSYYLVAKLLICGEREKERETEGVQYVRLSVMGFHSLQGITVYGIFQSIT